MGKRKGSVHTEFGTAVRAALAFLTDDKSLESQAHHLRLLAPYLQDRAEAAELMRQAGAR